MKVESNIHIESAIAPAFLLPGTRDLEAVHWLLLNEGISSAGLANSAELRHVAPMLNFTSRASRIHLSKQDSGTLQQPYEKSESKFWAFMEKVVPTDETPVPEISNDVIEILKSHFPSMDVNKIATAVHTIAKDFNNDSSPCDSQSTIPESPVLVEVQIPDGSVIPNPGRVCKKRTRACITNSVGGMLPIPVGI